jgi:formylmethanofuran dehydrogenase subunit D
MSLEVKLITGRTLHQGASMERLGKESEEYTKSVAVCEMDPADMEKLGVKEGDIVKVATDSGEVFLWAAKSRQAPHEGTIFIPMGPWANALVDAGTNSTGMPDFKGVKARVEPAPEGKVLNAVELVREIYGYNY